MRVTLHRTVLAGALAALLATAAPAGAFGTGSGARAGHDHGAGATPLRAAQTAPLVLGAGSRPGLAVDAAGIGYIAWNGTDYPTSLQFCRLPRGASACTARSAIAVPAATTSGSRPFVTVTGGTVRVVQYRYPTTGPAPAGVYEFVSTDSGAIFAAGTLIGTVPFEEAVQGPGDTLSGVPIDTEMAFQNVDLGGVATTAKAVLSVTHQNHASVGLIDANTPLAVFTSNDQAQERHYDGSGSLNDIANWTAPVDLGVATYPRLASGPTGLFLLAGNGNGSLFVRKWTGAGFGAAVTIGAGVTPSKHIFEDASGRLHAVFQRDSADPLHLVHAVSDDGMSWRSGTVLTQTIAANGGMSDLRVATAPDHVGITVWHAGLGGGDVRVAQVGPDAPVDPPTVSFTGSPKTLRVSQGGTFKYSFAVTAAASGTVGLKSTKKVQVGQHKSFVKIRAKKFSAAGPGTLHVKLKLSAKALKALKAAGKLSFKVTVTLGAALFTSALKLKPPKGH
ncbi:MAG: hypothetical protein QOD98_4388 [Nocardioidaceae bacterium]|nr:hypothetical protein [Nocardioidaceae bacterium]